MEERDGEGGGWRGRGRARKGEGEGGGGGWRGSEGDEGRGRGEETVCSGGEGGGREGDAPPAPHRHVVAASHGLRPIPPLPYSVLATCLWQHNNNIQKLVYGNTIHVHPKILMNYAVSGHPRSMG